jgi:hypothetical protein
MRKGARVDCTEVRRQLSVQVKRDPERTVQTLDRRNVQTQVFRAAMKTLLHQGQPFIVGDYYHARAIVIPLSRHWRGAPELIEAEAREKFKEALDLIPRD